MNRREFLKGASLGVGAGALGAMGLYSYTPMRKAFLPDIDRKMADFGVCKSVKVTNISETSWFDNGIFMKNVTGAGGLLVPGRDCYFNISVSAEVPKTCCNSR